MKKKQIVNRVSVLVVVVLNGLSAWAQSMSQTVTGSLDSRDYTLTVSSVHGSPSPAQGTQTNCWRSSVTCSVDSAVSEGGTNYTCSGWTGSGAIPVTGSTNNTGAVMLTDTISSITWNWVVQFDIDGDGLPDAWELQHFGNSTNANPNAVCSNGFNTVLDAYIAGLNPNDPQSRFMITIFRAMTDGKAFDWNTVSGRIYSVYWTTNLLNTFQPLETNIPWTRSSFTNSTTVPQCFYKINVQIAD